jgi:hypothetical protein
VHPLCCSAIPDTYSPEPSFYIAAPIAVATLTVCAHMFAMPHTHTTASMTWFLIADVYNATILLSEQRSCSLSLSGF